MTEFAHLWLFFLMVLGIIVLPGMGECVQRNLGAYLGVIRPD